jgi:penicillin-binding protein 1C
LTWLGVLAAFGLVAGLIAVAVVFAWVSRDLPDPHRLLNRRVQATTKIWDRTGKNLLYEIHGAQKRTLVELDQVASVAVKAAIVSEDRNFYEHKGFQLRSLFRAFLQAFRRGRVEGTSTITQQLIKNAILTNERALSRKAKELILAYQIERKFSKDEILKMYFNEIPYGSTAYGIESAAQTYFGKSAKDLEAAESALLAAMVRAPSRLSPYGTHKEELLWWQRFILDGMAEEGYLTKEEAEAAKTVDVIALIKPRRDAIYAPHFVLHVKELLSEKYGEREVENGGLNVITTLDFDKQKLAEEVVTNGMENVRAYGGSNAALLAMEAKSGQVLAMVGSADYFDKEHDGNVNVTLRPRQPGSSFKPIVYAAAFEKGYTPNTVVFDVNTSFPTDLGTPYEPKNYDLSEHGPVTLKKALAGSLNIPAVKALYLVGIDKAIDSAEKMGYSTLKDRSRFGLSLVLGGAEVKLVEHVAAFAVFATEGTYRAPAYILRVDGPDGKPLEEWKDEPRREVLSVQTARNINNILSDNAARAYIFGEKNYLTLPDRPVAAKTGTTNRFVDAWTMGYTPGLVAGVWVGNNDNTEMKSKADGSRVAAPIWQEFMKKAHEGAAIEPFAPPDPIVTGKPVLDGQAGEIKVRIDKFSDLLASQDTPESAVIERTYRQAHDILHFVDKDDPRGPYPADAHEDPQYLAWETAVADWAKRNGWETTEEPPSEVAPPRDPALAPTISFALPEDNAAIPERVFLARVAVSAPRGVSRVDYSIDGVPVGTATSFPWESYLSVPNIFGKGFYTLRATAFDDLENHASQDITINVQAEGVPLEVTWIRPSTDVAYRQRVFPLTIDAALSDRRGVLAVDLLARPEEGAALVLGTIKAPTTNGISATWYDAPEPGVYRLVAIAKVANGETREFPGPKITVKE